jgi:transposase
MFLAELFDKLSPQEKEKFVFFMDNLSSHCTAGLFSFYNKNKMKIIFNTSYRSNFNMAELCFRHIKRETYTHLYSNIEDMKNDINEILIGEKMKNSLKLFYKSTLEQYLKYINENKFINLN